MNMMVTPKVRGFICTTSHPTGCEAQLKNQIDYILKEKSKLPNKKFNIEPKNILILGASQGFGLAARVTAAVAANAKTLGVFFEKEPSSNRTASAGWYNTAAFEKYAGQQGIYAKSINGDAFSNEIKTQTIDLIKQDLGKIDLVIYSLAAPRRTDPKTGEVYNSVLKPIGSTYFSKTVNVATKEVHNVEIEPASNEEIQNTAKVMGGEDWELWIDLLAEQGLLTDNCKTVAFTYIGPEITYPIYWEGTIGKAKEHLEVTAKKLNQKLQKLYNGQALISVNKCLVTQASSAIPVVPLYTSILYKVMKEKGIHEDTIQQMWRLFAEHLYSGKELNLDDKNRIRLDDLEMRADVQAEVASMMDKINTENIDQLSDIDGYRKAFYQLFGFEIANVDYAKEVDVEVAIESIPVHTAEA
jgi:enoyl-[acyl-carrier protein] reductase / trans-2-enoyl-CoA reductase (NAD+)